MSRLSPASNRAKTLQVSPSRAASTRSTPTRSTRSFTLGLLANVMEGLIKRDKDLKIIPGLAERWEMLEPDPLALPSAQGRERSTTARPSRPTTWCSRPNARAGPGSQLKTRIPADAKVEKVDDLHGRLRAGLAQSDPALRMGDVVHRLQGMVGGQRRRQGADRPRPTSLSPFALKANGTGPFVVASHEPGVKTVFRPNPNWWGKAEHNLDEVVFQTINSDATRVAALLSGDIDLIDPVPVQDIDAHQGEPRTRRCSTAPELRTIFLNMDSMREELRLLERQGPQPIQGRARAQGLLPGHRHRGDQDQGDARHGRPRRR